MNWNWTCPHCDRPQTVTSDHYAAVMEPFKAARGAEGHLGALMAATVCANPECKKTTVFASVLEYRQSQNGTFFRPESAGALLTRRLLPEGSAKPLPDYIPQAIKDDYREACLIRELSPKASATLSRRCLQGMIRDFASIKVKGGRLFDEIAALKRAVDEGSAPRDVSEASVEAIDAARTVGNIGAHMEVDIGVIVDVDPNEAGVLIDLIESLIDDWYVNRFRREERFAKTIALATEKKSAIASGRQAALPAPTDEA